MHLHCNFCHKRFRMLRRHTPATTKYAVTIIDKSTTVLIAFHLHSHKKNYGAAPATQRCDYRSGNSY